MNGTAPKLRQCLSTPPMFQGPESKLNESMEMHVPEQYMKPDSVVIIRQEQGTFASWFA
jgi:hypothetical protein